MTLIFITRVSGFYLPGLAPVNYCEFNKPADNCRSDVKLFVNRLDSEDSVIPYEYSHFDFCQANNQNESPVENLGQIVFGERIRSSPYNISFLKNEQCKFLCHKQYDTSKREDFEKLDSLKKGMMKNYQHRWIVDNMPVTWCYDVEGGQKYCSTGFPMGCYVDKDGIAKDACVMNILFNKKDTFYLFNHVDITITFHSGQNEAWGVGFGDHGGRIIAVNIVPKSIQHKQQPQTPSDCPSNPLP
ncbi:hypothetical protein BLA29_009933, partial [Euroglyphus maynei]